MCALKSRYNKKCMLKYSFLPYTTDCRNVRILDELFQSRLVPYTRVGTIYFPFNNRPLLIVYNDKNTQADKSKCIERIASPFQTVTVKGCVGL